ncbi:MAG: shikimate dehydrogenase [Polyangiaceae bacterium]|nr:shikimate dehydrogenase [Polyangiaceae bacterium]
MSALRFAVIGDPIGHSKSPRMHAAGFAALGMPHRYEARRVEAKDLPAAMEQLRRGLFDGYNVTIPHKQSVLALVDEVDEGAAMVGAANTITRNSRGRLKAYNTDVAAVTEELRNLAPEASFASGVAIILGSGGAARSAVVALARDLSTERIEIRGRAFENDPGAGQRLSADLGERLGKFGLRAEIVCRPLSTSDSDTRATCIIQATSAGMHGADDGRKIAAAVAWNDVPVSAVAFDVVYNPPQTPFLTAAEEAGIRASNGLGMLARQGALAFELWLGRSAPYNAMLSALID